MSIELKIKSKHLALEPAIIRKEERKLQKQIKLLEAHQSNTDELQSKRNSLHCHRVFNVRNEARATYLARAYIEGMAYSKVEKKMKDKSYFNVYIVPRIIAMVAKYGPKEDRAYKFYNRNTGKQEFRKEDFTTLCEKIENWMTT